MSTLANIENKIAVKIETLALAEKQNQIILSRSKENKITKQQEFIEKRLGEINDLKNQGQEIMLESDKVSFEEVKEWGSKFRKAVSRYNILMDARKQAEIIYGNGKIEQDRSGRKRNGADDDGDVAAFEEERRK